MPLLLVAALVVLVHLATGWSAWHDVGLLADDHEMIGAAILRHRGDWTLAGAFFPEPMAGASRALYRPFVDLLFWLEYPLFGIEAFGYHVVNSAMHCGTALVWFVLLRRWTGSAAAGLATALWFVCWPGHSEATHWIAARTNVMSVFYLSLALLAQDVALTDRRALRRVLAFALAAFAAVVAIGCKESAVLVVPAVALLSWQRSPDLPKAFFRSLPVVFAAFAWLSWRATRLGTWGSGTHYGWQFQRVGAASCSDWLQVLLQPVHHDCAPAVWLWLMPLLQLTTLVAAVFALRSPKARPAAALGGLFVLLGYLAGIGLESLDPDTLENVRYTYEPALGLCVLGGLGVAALPSRGRGPALALLVGCSTLLLNANRESWLGAARIYRSVTDQAITMAQRSEAVHVVDVPGVHDGAFAWLNGYTEFLFLQQTSLPTVVQGSMASTTQWRDTLVGLAAQAAGREPRRPLQTVRWNDGGFVPLPLDDRWPRRIADGVTVDFARIARVAAFAGSRVPVDVLLTAEREVQVVAHSAAGSDSARVDPGAARAARLWVPIGAAAGEPCPISLVLTVDGATAEIALGGVSPVARR